MAGIPALTDEQWEECMERVTFHAAGIFRKHGWLGRGGKFEHAGPQGQSPQDLASEAIVSVVEGTRHCDAKTFPDFVKSLKSVVDSKIHHLAVSLESRMTQPMPQQASAAGDDPTDIEFPGAEQDPAEACIAKEEAYIAKKMIEVAREALARDQEGDSLALSIFECLEEGITKRSEIAELLGMDVKDIDNAQKRLRRKMEQIIAAHGREGRA